MATGAPATLKTDSDSAAQSLHDLLACLRTSASAVLGEVTDAAIIAAIVSMSATLTVWQMLRSERAVARLQDTVLLRPLSGEAAYGRRSPAARLGRPGF